MKTQKQYWQKLQDPRWQKKRLEILNEAGFECECCGDTKSQLQVHHGYYEKGKEPWEYDDETLWCLCDRCHEDAHKGRNAVCSELAKYRPWEVWPIAEILRRTDGDTVFYAQLFRIMEKRPGWIERVVNILHESLSDASTCGAVVENPREQTALSTQSELDLVWENLLQAVGRVSQFTRGYLLEAYPVSFNGGFLHVAFEPEFADHLSLVDNPKNQAVLQAKMAELGHPVCGIRFTVNESKPKSK